MPLTPTAAVRAALRHAAARLPDVLGPGGRVLVAFSGGQDSTCLLHALLEGQRTHGYRVLAAHVDHALRAESEADAARAAEMARAMGAEAVAVRRVDVAAYRAVVLRRASVQQAARGARYHTLASLAAERGAGAVAVAHTADDQAETLLLHLLRGAGLAGLAGMRLDERLRLDRLGPPPAEAAAWGGPTTDTVRLVRPLLGVERATTLAYCQEAGLPLLHDRSNLGRAYTRNRVRLDLLPALERFNPAVRSALARTAELAAEDLEALERATGERHAALASSLAEGGFAFDLAALRAEPRGLQRRLLRRCVALLGGGLEDVPAQPLEDVLDYVAAAPADGVERVYHLPRGLEARASRGVLWLQPRGAAANPKAPVGPSV